MSGSKLKKLYLFPLPEMMIIKQEEEQEQHGDEQHHRDPFK
jgi:hypothetical protein